MPRALVRAGRLAGLAVLTAALPLSLPLMLRAQTVPSGWATSARIARVDIAPPAAALPGWVATDTGGSDGLEDLLRRAMSRLGATMAGPMPLRLGITPGSAADGALSLTYSLSDAGGRLLARSDSRPLPRPEAGTGLGAPDARLADAVARDAANWIAALGCLPAECRAAVAEAPVAPAAPGTPPETAAPTSPTAIDRFFAFLGGSPEPADPATAPPPQDDTPTARAPQQARPPAPAARTRPASAAEAPVITDPPVARTPGAAPTVTGEATATAAPAPAPSAPGETPAPAAAGVVQAMPPEHRPRRDMPEIVTGLLRAEHAARSALPAEVSAPPGSAAAGAGSGAAAPLPAAPVSAAPLPAAPVTPQQEAGPEQAPVAAAEATPAGPMPRVAGRWIGSTPAEVSSGGASGTWMRTRMVQEETQGWATVETTGATAAITLLPEEMRLDRAAALSPEAGAALRLPAGSDAQLSIYVPR
ncbi:hypothetical protein [Oceanicella sp. SM1341]|uniref:hypothetical protein n=1 Tax=Oceanicella sp. SM1341 TaxID=1548889 RepID=UPI000E4E38A1|nr:hypothetical protein [Oceanicella sp. SM1341]